MPQWGAPAPAGGSSGGGSSSIAAILGIVGGAVGILSTFLAWFTVKGGGASKSHSLWALLSGGDDVPLESNDAIFLLIAAVAAVALGVLAMKGKAQLASILLIVAGLAMVVVGVRDWMSVADLAKDLPSSVKIEGGIGLYLAYAGGAVAAIGGVLGLVGPKKS